MNENKSPPTFAKSRNCGKYNEVRPSGLAFVACLSAGGIFSLDIALSLGALAGMPYTTVVILGWFAEGWYFTLAATAATTMLTIAGHFLSPHGSEPHIDIANRAIALFAIWGTATLIFHAKRRQDNEMRNLRGLPDKLQQTQSEMEALRSDQLRLKRLATMGEKAGTTAHELRNPLGVIATSMGVIEFKARQADLDLNKPLDRAHRAIRRCEHIIDEHLDRARARGHRPEPVVIDAWLAGLLADMEIGADISLITDFKADGVIAEIDQDSFRRILINLVDNAIQALSETTKQNTVTIGSLADNDSAEIYVEDNGPGIAPHLLDHVTKALFSTKPYGTGLGLPTVQRIIEEHGGTMTIESEPQRGTRVILRLPKSSPAQADET